MPNEDELDKLLDNSLARYSAVEPLTGLEERIMQRLAAGQHRRTTGNFARWAAAIGCLTTLSAFAVLVQIRETESAHARLAQPRQVATETLLPIALPQQRFSLTAPAGRGKRRPKQSDFPVRTPMTPEEKALLRLATYSKGAFSDLDKVAEPIQIAPVEVEPVLIDDSNEQKRSVGDAQ
jgi:hypothetical protein